MPTMPFLAGLIKTFRAHFAPKIVLHSAFVLFALKLESEFFPCFAQRSHSAKTSVSNYA